MKTVIIDGVEYELVPIVRDENILDYYSVPKNVTGGKIEPSGSTDKYVDTTTNNDGSGVKRAEPGVYGYKERLKSKKLLASDVMAVNGVRPLIKDLDPDPGNSMSKEAGYNVWVGEGTTVDF